MIYWSVLSLHDVHGSQLSTEILFRNTKKKYPLTFRIANPSFPLFCVCICVNTNETICSNYCEYIERPTHKNGPDRDEAFSSQTYSDN